MAIVDLSKISEVSMYPIDGNEPPKDELYDSLWGYYTIKQSVSFDYNESDYLYTSKGEVTIDGIFTINTEADGDQDSMTDEDRFDLLKAKYNVLLSYFKGTSSSIPPEDLSYYGTSSDSRCVMLPDRLFDSSGNNVYMRPRSIGITKSRWTEYIKYTAVLEEISQSTCKIMVDDYIIDEATVTVNGRSPRLSEVNYLHANSGDLFFSGYENRSYQIKGNVYKVLPSGGFYPENMNGLTNSLSTGRFSFGIKKYDNTEEVISEDLYITGSSVSSNGDKDGISLSIEGKE